MAPAFVVHSLDLHNLSSLINSTPLSHHHSNNQNHATKIILVAIA